MVRVSDSAITAIDRALDSWSETSRALWQQADARIVAVVNAIELERRRCAVRVAALESRQQPTGRITEQALESQLAKARDALVSIDRALHDATAAQSAFASNHRRSIQNLDPAVSAARADLQRGLRLLDTYAAGGEDSGSPSITSASAQPGNGLTGVTSRGLQDIELATIDFSENPLVGVFGKGGAKLVDYRWAVETWENVVRPGLQRSMSRDDFAERDRAREAQPLRRTADVYDLFLGDTDQIVVSRSADGRYDVINGRHRILVARQLGITTLPGRIVS